MGYAYLVFYVQGNPNERHEVSNYLAPIVYQLIESDVVMILIAKKYFQWNVRSDPKLRRILSTS
jgi:hypothetical protein